MTPAAPRRDGARAIAVAGVGNILYGDEGVGVYAAHYLRRAFGFEPEIEIADGAALGFSLLDLFQDRTTVIVLDALQADASPGTVFRLPTEMLLDLDPSMRPTAHEVDPIQALQLVRGLGRDTDLVLLGIVPHDASQMSLGLTEPLFAAFPRLIEAAISEIRGWGVHAERRSGITLEEVVAGMVRQAA